MLYNINVDKGTTKTLKGEKEMKNTKKEKYTIIEEGLKTSKKLAWSALCDFEYLIERDIETKEATKLYKLFNRSYGKTEILHDMFLEDLKNLPAKTFNEIYTTAWFGRYSYCIDEQEKLVKELNKLLDK